MSKKLKFILLFLVVLFLAGALAFNYVKTKSPKEELIGGQKDEGGCLIGAGYSWCEVKQKCLRVWEEKCEKEVIDETDETSDWETYNSDKYKFEIKIPSTWEGYRANSGEYPTYSYVGFSFGKPHQPFEIFKIISYTQDQWNDIINKSLLTVLHQSDDQILACDGCCVEGGDALGGGQFDQFQIERCKEVPSILKTFKVTQ